MSKMTREEVETRLGVYYSARFGGKVWSLFDYQRRVYCIRGDCLPAHESLRTQHPNGWSLLDYVTPKIARELVTGKTDADLQEMGRVKAAEVKKEADAVFAKDKPESITVIIADGLDASVDGRGWGAEHARASQLADAAPAMYDALKALRASAAAVDEAQHAGIKIDPALWSRLYNDRNTATEALALADKGTAPIK